MNLLGNLFHKESHQHKQAYDFGEVLGQGGFGVVSQAHDKETDRDVAIKKVPKKSIKNRDAYRRLITFMRDNMDHPNTINLISFFSSSTSYYLVFELASGGDLIDRLNSAGGHLSEDEARQAVTAILKATSYLHARNVLHRDIKLDNYLYRSKDAPAGEVILIDFGQAVLLPSHDVKLLEPCGSPTYIAPEIYNFRGYSFPADMWAIGVITFNVLSGRSLYTSANPQIIENETKQFTDVKFNDLFWHDVSGDAKDFIQRLLKPNPNERMTVDEALQHGWIRHEGVSQIAPKKASLALDAHVPIARAEKVETLRLNEGQKPNELLELDGSSSGDATPRHPQSGSATPVPQDAKAVRERDKGDKIMLPGNLYRKLSRVVGEEVES